MPSVGKSGSRLKAPIWPTANSLSEKLALQVVPIFSSDIVEAPIVSDIQTLKKKKKNWCKSPIVVSGLITVVALLNCWRLLIMPVHTNGFQAKDFSGTVS